MFTIGAGSGIGRATLRRLLDDGFHVAAVDKSTDSINSMKLPEAQHKTFVCDVSKHSDIKKLLAGIGNWQSGVTPKAVVNAAGIIRENWLLNMTEAEFDEVLNVNLKVSCYQ